MEMSRIQSKESMAMKELENKVTDVTKQEEAQT